MPLGQSSASQAGSPQLALPVRHRLAPSGGLCLQALIPRFALRWEEGQEGLCGCHDDR